MKRVYVVFKGFMNKHDHQDFDMVCVFEDFEEAKRFVVEHPTMLEDGVDKFVESDGYARWDAHGWDYVTLAEVRPVELR